MSTQDGQVLVRSLADTDIGGITALDEKISGSYRPEVWEDRAGYYLRREPDASAVAELNGKVVGFMLGDLRAGEFGLEEPTGWIEVMGVDPQVRGQSVGRQLAERVIGQLEKLGAVCVRTLVDEESSGIAEFFAALGFEAAGLRPFVKRL